MPTSNNLLALTAILALTTLPTATLAANKKHLRKNNANNQNRRLRRGQINHIDTATKNKEDGLEEDVVFWTNMARRMQDMSIPATSPPVPTPTTNQPTGGGDGSGGGGGDVPTLPPIGGAIPTNPPILTEPPIGGAIPTQPPVTGSIPTLPPVGVITNPPVPVVGVICLQGETCAAEGDICSDGTQEECCGETFDSFQCTCTDSGGVLTNECANTDACLNKVCATDPPAPGPPAPTQSPIAETGGFNCPDPSFVGCTAVDPTNFEDECPTVGEPCPNAVFGEFCCLDGCPRNYCTAKQAPSSTNEAAKIIFALPEDWKDMEGLEKNDPDRA
mmetsp:Transcript_26342/g.48450  ORF Transcript_26342/g.48450 Transcript_26342/m.48450 type:complete len:331 (-) Transcript_26342:257-1249(-)